MGARSKARKRALDMLFQAAVRAEPLAHIVAAEAARAASEPDRAASWLYAREIVDGVADHRTEIDELIVSYAQGWQLERMPHVDLAVLRLATWELLHNEQVPAAVAINEAIELVKQYSTADSARFVNGVLSNIVRHRAPEKP